MYQSDGLRLGTFSFPTVLFFVYVFKQNISTPPFVPYMYMSIYILHIPNIYIYIPEILLLTPGSGCAAIRQFLVYSLPTNKNSREPSMSVHIEDSLVPPKKHLLMHAMITSGGKDGMPGTVLQ